jgi:hypothetical protein
LCQKSYRDHAADIGVLVPTETLQSSAEPSTGPLDVWCLVSHGQLFAKRQNFEVQEGAVSEQSE